MSDDASPYPLTDSPSGRLGPTFSTLWALLFLTGLLGVGVYQICVLPPTAAFFWLWLFNLVMLSLMLQVPLGWWWNTVGWFEWKDGVLRYRLTGRSQVHSLLLPEIVSLQPITRPVTTSGFEI